MFERWTPAIACTIGGFIAGVMFCCLLSESPRESDRREISSHKVRIRFLERLVDRHKSERDEENGKLREQLDVLARISRERRIERIASEEVIMRWQERCAKAEWIVRKYHLEDEKVPHVE